MSAKIYARPDALPLSTNWWAVGLRGLVAVLFGVLTFITPAITLSYLVFLFALYALLDGVLNIVAALRAPHGQNRWWAMLFVGIAGVLTAVLTFLYPGTTALVLLYFVAAWAVITGVMQIVAAIRLRKVITGEWLLVLGGVLSVLFGIVLYMAPGAGALALVLWIGAYAIALGAVLIALAFRLRSWTRRQDTLQPA